MQAPAALSNLRAMQPIQDEARSGTFGREDDTGSNPRGQRVV